MCIIWLLFHQRTCLCHQYECMLWENAITEPQFPRLMAKSSFSSYSFLQKHYLFNGKYEKALIPFIWHNIVETLNGYWKKKEEKRRCILLLQCSVAHHSHLLSAETVTLNIICVDGNECLLYVNPIDRMPLQWTIDWMWSLSEWILSQGTLYGGIDDGAGASHLCGYYA